MELVQGEREAKGKNPKIHLVYSIPKIGKTTIVSHLKDHLLLELEPNGAEYVKGRIQELNKPSEFTEVLRLIAASPIKVCTYLVIDTVTKLDEWSEIVGTYNYMTKGQGKKFNRTTGKNKDGKEVEVSLTHLDKRFESVHSLPNGYGYAHSRDAMVTWYDQLNDLIVTGKVDYIILLCHVKDKLIESRNGDTVEHIDINLTGKVKTIFASRVDAIGHLYKEEGKCYLSYANEDNVVCGGRCPHLEGNILISEKIEGKIVTYWDNVYIK